MRFPFGFLNGIEMTLEVIPSGHRDSSGRRETGDTFSFGEDGVDGGLLRVVVPLALRAGEGRLAGDFGRPFVAALLAGVVHWIWRLLAVGDPAGLNREAGVAPRSLSVRGREYFPALAVRSVSVRFRAGVGVLQPAPHKLIYRLRIMRVSQCREGIGNSPGGAGGSHKQRRNSLRATLKAILPVLKGADIVMGDGELVAPVSGGDIFQNVSQRSVTLSFNFIFPWSHVIILIVIIPLATLFSEIMFRNA